MNRYFITAKDKEEKKRESEYHKKWYIKNKDRVLENNRKWRERQSLWMI